jgi:molybdopterin/thiamine biosynthesis adenylyltransferase
MQDKDKEWYEQFNIIICGLDSVPARRWINSTLFSMLGKKKTFLSTFSKTSHLKKNKQDIMKKEILNWIQSFQ